MKNCPNLQKSLDWCEGAPQYPGIRRRLYYINKNLIVDWPTLDRDEFGRIIDAHYMGAFTLAADAAWQYIDINIDKSTVTSEPQGEVPSQTQLNKATFVHNGIDAEATAAAGYLNNADCVFVYEDMIGHFRVLGNNKWRTKITVNQDQGQGTNPASTTISVEVTDMIAPPFYVEGLETEDGEVFPSYDDDALLEPRLTSPSGTSFDIGTIADSGSSVSKTMHIQGVNLTEPLTLTKSGTGLTVSKSTITANEAKAGIDITLTYTKSTSGAGSLNGSLRIYSAEVDKTITVTAKKAALTSPSASSIDVGTIASDGSSVQKSITVQGTNLSKAVSLRVTGNGFSLSKSSLSASQVNNGAAVIVYYNNSSQGPASVTGSLVISSDEVSKTIELTAAKAAPAAQPQLSLPTEDTIDMGTIPNDETSVQVYVPIKGINLTEPLSISINMKGFSVSTSTISVQQANAGSGVFVTYQNSLEGPATAQATLTIASNEVRKQVTMTAAKAAQHDTIDDYIQDGLIFHLDGINKGEVENQWTDLINGVAFPNHGATAEENGFLFEGTGWLGVKDTSGAEDLDFDPSTITIEAAYRDDSIAAEGFAICTFGTQTSATGKPALLMNSAYNAKYINGMYLQGTQNVWSDPLIDGAVAAHTISVSAARAFDNANQLSSLGVNHWSTNKGGRFVGATNNANNVMAGFAVGKIFSIRVYNRQLSETEIRHNQRVDNQRFNLGIDLTEEDDDSV
jgi:hypothetical protein